MAVKARESSLEIKTQDLNLVMFNWSIPQSRVHILQYIDSTLINSELTSNILKLKLDYCSCLVQLDGEAHFSTRNCFFKLLESVSKQPNNVSNLL